MPGREGGSGIYRERERDRAKEDEWSVNEKKREGCAGCEEEVEEEKEAGGSGWLEIKVPGWHRPASKSTPLDSNFERQPTRKSGFKSLSISAGVMARRVLPSLPPTGC
ncbi:uncharacterized protein LOC113464940 [Ceratina calcarata]|uniref:Uncharacterized protein LOC113464940 n=1 Tax=Ceratina calcarata TaxID=156304 RepID=A0AAJ7S9V0_9HYME|nr:uncharacterized protein LOC113464940 [Ceratina calcarata]